MKIDTRFLILGFLVTLNLHCAESFFSSLRSRLRRNRRTEEPEGSSYQENAPPPPSTLNRPAVIQNANEENDHGNIIETRRYNPSLIRQHNIGPPYQDHFISSQAISEQVRGLLQPPVVRRPPQDNIPIQSFAVENSRGSSSVAADTSHSPPNNSDREGDSPDNRPYTFRSPRSI